MIMEDLIVKMTEFNAGDPKRIQHFLKVYEFAHVIGTGKDWIRRHYIFWKWQLSCTISEFVLRKKNTADATERCRSRKVLPTQRKYLHSSRR